MVLKFFFSHFSKRLFNTSTILHARNIKPYNVGLEGQYRKARSKKVIKIELPDFDELRTDNKMTSEEYISKMKEKGIAPPIIYKEKPIVITTTQGIIDPYVPPEGDGKYSVLSTTGVSQKLKHAKQKSSTLLALKKIRSYEDDFNMNIFAHDSLKLYIKAHELLAENKTDELLNYVTEFAYPVMTFQREYKSIKWNFIKTNEDPKVIQMRTHHLIEKTNMFAQITVRFNTRQILAIYDRFGYLIYGSDAIVKDVLEYVVFEKNLSDYNGKWRLHSKIIPEWSSQKDPILKTFIKAKPPAPPTEEEIKFAQEGIISNELKEQDNEKTASN